MTLDKFTHAKAGKLYFCSECNITLESYPLPMLFLLYVVANNYMCVLGEKFLNAVKCKYTCINDSTATEAASLRYPSTVQMFDVQKYMCYKY